MVRIRLIGAWIALASLWTVLSLLRHGAGETAAYDLGIFQQTLWNLTHGYGYVSSLKGEVLLWSDHQSPILWLFAPFFALVPRSETLLILQAWTVAAGILPLYAWARRKTTLPVALTVTALYAVSQPIRSAVLFDFHPEILFLPLGFAWLEAWDKRRKSTWVWFALWIMTKETAALAILACLAVLYWEEPRRRRELTLGAGIAAMWFAICIAVIPRLSGGAVHAYQAMYGTWGASWSDMLLLPLTHPLVFLQKAVAHLLHPERLAFAWKLCASVGFALVLSRRALRFGGAALVAALPVLLMSDTHRVNPHYHYGVDPSFGLLIAAAWGLAHVQKTQSPLFLRRLLFVIGSVALLRGGSFHIPQARDWWKASQDPARAQLLKRDLPLLQESIGLDRGLAVPERWAPRLASRAHLYLHNQIAEFHPDCVLSDPQDREFPPSLVGYSREKESSTFLLWRRSGATKCAE